MQVVAVADGYDLAVEQATLCGSRPCKFAADKLLAFEQPDGGLDRLNLMGLIGRVLEFELCHMLYLVLAYMCALLVVGL